MHTETYVHKQQAKQLINTVVLQWQQTDFNILI